MEQLSVLRTRILDAARIGDQGAIRVAITAAMAAGVDPHSGYELLWGTGNAPMIVAATNGHELSNAC